MDDDFDIYEDLPLTCDIKDNGASAGNNENISKECEELKKEVTELTTKLQKLQKINETLEVNLSSLLKTAKAEIARKDKMIDELRKQVDDMSFKRGYFNRNRREINGKSVQQISAPNMQELSNVQAEYTTSSTIENNTLVKKIPNVNQFGQDQDESDYEGCSNKRYEAKYRTTNFIDPSKLPTTIFAERLRKRIIEEEEAEQMKKLEEKEKQNLLLENNHENNRKINIDDKENQSHFGLWNSNVDNTNSKCKGAEHDYTDNIISPDDTAAYIENQQRIVVNTKISGKRTDDIDMPCSKRRKLETEQHTCVTKDYLSKKEDAFNVYNDEIISNTSINKFDYKEDINNCVERNDPHYNVQYERDHSRARSNDGHYKRKEHYKKPGSDYNYSKENTYYHEKDKYNRTRNRSPISRYSDRKQKYHDDRYRNHKDKFDRRQNFQNKEEETQIVSNKKFYDLRHKDKIKFNGKYNSTDFYSPRHKEIRYSDSRVCRSVSHERRSKSGSRERTNHKIYDKRTSKSTRTNNDIKKFSSTSLKKKDEINKLKGTSTSRKKDDILEKPVKISSKKSLESAEIVDNSLFKSSMNIENNKKVQIAVRESVNVDNENKSENELVSSKPIDSEYIANSHIFIKDENSINIECKKNENNDRVTAVEDIVQIVTNVNISPETTHIHLDENKQNCVITSADTIAEKQSKCEEAINTRDTITNFPRDSSNSLLKLSAEAAQENNVAHKHNVETEELQVCNKLDIVRNNSFSNEINTNPSNLSKNKHSGVQNSHENQTSPLNDLKESPAVKPQQKNEQDNNENDHAKSKDSESKKKSSERETSKIIVLARRRKRVQLADNDASMTIVITANNTNADTDLKNNTENSLKSRACKVSRSYKNVL